MRSAASGPRFSRHIDLCFPLPALDDQFIIQEQIGLRDDESLVEVSGDLASHAQETDPVAVVTAQYEAWNAGDIEAFLAALADDAVFTILPFPPGATYTGLEEMCPWAGGPHGAERSNGI